MIKKIHRQYLDGTGFCLSWNIYDEINFGNHTPEQFVRMIEDESIGRKELRRYSEVLLGKGVGERRMIRILVDRLCQNSISEERVGEVYSAFDDWKLFSRVQRRGKFIRKNGENRV